MRAFLFVAAVLVAVPARADDFRLDLPVACTPGTDCWVQQYPDHDPTKGVRDYACGAQTYDGHDGTDIRIRDTSEEAAVIAAAPGTVKAVRDGEPDRLMRSEADRARVGNRECGNGVLIVHQGGWETQYCHMREGTVAVKPGDTVAAGAPLGKVGYSGMAAFPHVHLTVRRDGKAIDPFRTTSDDSCGADGETLWTGSAASALAYQRGVILRHGFAAAPVELPDLEAGLPAETGLDGTWPALVAYLWAINLEAGDEIVVRLDGPGDLDAENRVVLDRAKAQYLLFAGRKRPPGGWPPGEYRAEIRIGKGGEARLVERWQATLD